MRVPSYLTVLTGLNLALLVWLGLAARDAIAGQAGAPVLRASAIELVDDGRRREVLVTLTHSSP